MWSTTALLVLLSLGVSAIIAADVNSDAEAQRFLDRVSRSIASKDPAVIAGLFHPGFVFTGCKGVYNKEKVVGMLSHLPSGAKFNSTLKSSEFLKDDQIRYTVEVTGFGEQPLIAEFILGRGDQQLLGGSVPSCSKTRVARDDVKATVEKFLVRITRSVESKDESIIAGLFQPGFNFTGCKGVYNKSRIVGILMQTPAGTKMNFTLQSAVDQGASIKYLVAFQGPNKAEIVAEFVLNKQDQQLEYGSIPSCQKKRLARAASETPETISEGFLKRAKEVIRRYDSGAVARLFADKFTVKGCAGVYDKAASVAQIGRIDTENPFDYELISAEYLNVFGTINQKKVRFVAKIYGIWDDFTADFLYDVENQNLIKGQYTSCKKVPSRSARDMNSDIIINNFMATFKSAVYVTNKYGDDSLLKQLLHESFTVKGCEGTYDKVATVAQIKRVDTENPFGYRVKSSDFNRQNQIWFLAEIYGIWDDMTAEFLYSPSKNELMSARYLTCEKKKPSRKARSLF